MKKIIMLILLMTILVGCSNRELVEAEGRIKVYRHGEYYSQGAKHYSIDDNEVLTGYILDKEGKNVERLEVVDGSLARIKHVSNGVLTLSVGVYKGKIDGEVLTAEEMEKSRFNTYFGTLHGKEEQTDGGFRNGRKYRHYHYGMLHGESWQYGSLKHYSQGVEVDNIDEVEDMRNLDFKGAKDYKLLQKNIGLYYEGDKTANGFYIDESRDSFILYNFDSGKFVESYRYNILEELEGAALYDLTERVIRSAVNNEYILSTYRFGKLRNQELISGNDLREELD